MFRTRQLIIASALILIGCSEQLESPQYFSTEPEIVDSIQTKNQWEGLSSIDATLAMADEVMAKQMEEERRTQNTIIRLRTTVTSEEAIIDSLRSSISFRDSLINQLDSIQKTQHASIVNLREELQHRQHICTTECTPTIFQLKNENKQLLNYIQELQSQIEIMDSLLLDNRKTRKIYEPTTGRSF